MTSQPVMYNFTSGNVACFFNGRFAELEAFVERETTILITDSNVFAAHKEKFDGWKSIVIEPGEKNKTQATVTAVVQQLVELKADRSTGLVGVGGGVVTDITGYVASVYMRGVQCGFVPTTVLGMVDAAIGGKNGIDVGVYKNLVGTVRQPEFLLFDMELLATLPDREWSNGFAEIIKHACIRDAYLFEALEQQSLEEFRQNSDLLRELVRHNVSMKSEIVQSDETETGERRVLNFGHTVGHAIETTCQLAHGEAIAIGMMIACSVSERYTGFYEKARIQSILEKYGLPTSIAYNKDQVVAVLGMDKKKERDRVRFILLDMIGNALVQEVSLLELEQMI